MVRDCVSSAHIPQREDGMVWGPMLVIIHGADMAATLKREDQAQSNAVPVCSEYTCVRHGMVAYQIIHLASSF